MSIAKPLIGLVEKVRLFQWATLVMLHNINNLLCFVHKLRLPPLINLSC